MGEARKHIFIAICIYFNIRQQLTPLLL